MTKSIPWHPNAICDACGATGALDLDGDLLCFDCADLYVAEYEDEPSPDDAL